MHMFLTANYKIHWKQFISDEGKDVLENLSKKWSIGSNSIE